MDGAVRQRQQKGDQGRSGAYDKKNTRGSRHLDGGKKATGGFVGFSAFATSPGAFGGKGGAGAGRALALARPSAVFAGHDSEVASLFKKLKKKDPSTKAKALESLRCRLFGNKDDDGDGYGDAVTLSKGEVILGLNHFAFLFHNAHSPASACLAYHNSIAVRAAAARCWAQAASRVPKAARALLLHGCAAPDPACALGVLWCLSCDSAKEVAVVAEEAVDAVLCSCFVDSEATAEAVRAIAAHLNRVIPLSRHKLVAAAPASVTPASSTSVPNEAQEEDDERYERIIVSALNAASRLVQTFPEAGPDADNEAAASNKGGHGDNQHSVGSILAYGDAFDRGVLWKQVGSQRGTFRRSTYRLISCALQHSRSVFMPHSALRPPLSAALASEKDPANHASLFEALLLYMRTFPLQDALLSAPRKSQPQSTPADSRECSHDQDDEWAGAICKAMCKQLRRACFGSPCALWCPLILPFLAALPRSRPEKPEPLYFQCQTLSSLWEGRKSVANASDEAAIASALSEGCTYLMMRPRSRRGRGLVPDEDEDPVSGSDRDRNVGSVVQLFADTVKWYLQSGTGVAIGSEGRGRSRGRLHRYSNTGDAATATMARDLIRLDNASSNANANGRMLLHRHEETLWELIASAFSDPHRSKQLASIDGEDCSAEEDGAPPSIRTLALATALVTSISPTSDSGEGNEDGGGEGDTAFLFTQTKMARTRTRTSKLLPGLRRLFFDVVHDSSSLPLPAKSQLDLLPILLAFCGVPEMFREAPRETGAEGSPLAAECEANSRGRPSTDIRGSGELNEAVAAFCMGTLLQWTLFLGTNTLDNCSVEERDSMVRSCFLILSQCLETLNEAPTSHGHDDVWESFLRELVSAKCQLVTLSLGIAEVSNHLGSHVRCRELDEFAIAVGSAAEDLARNDLGAEHGSHSLEDDSEIEVNEVKTFLQVCAGLLPNSHGLLVGHTVVETWMRTCVPDTKSQTEPWEFNAAGGSALLSILVLMAMKKSCSLGYADFLRLSLEAWRRGGTVWTMEVYPIILASEKDAVAFLAMASGSLKGDVGRDIRLSKDLQQSRHFPSWSSRAWRLIELQEKCNVRYQSTPTQNTFELIGLGAVDEWMSRRLQNSTDTAPCVSMGCFLISFLDMAETDGSKRTLVEDFLNGEVGGNVLAECLYSILFLALMRRQEMLKRHVDSALDWITDVAILEQCVIHTIQLITEECASAVDSDHATTGNKRVGVGVQLLDRTTKRLVELLGMSSSQDDEVLTASEIREHDILWYSPNDSPAVQVSVVAIHLDDFPNLYFTIKEQQSQAERQTIASRLRKTPPTGFKRPNGSNASVLNRLERLIVDRLVTPFFSSMRQPDVLVPLAETMNIVIARTGLQDSGLGSSRYDIFQIVGNLERSFVDGVRRRHHGSTISGPDTGTPFPSTGIEGTVGPLDCELPMVCFARAMGVGRFTERSRNNFLALRFEPALSLSLMSDLSSDGDWIRSKAKAHGSGSSIDGRKQNLHLISAMLELSTAIVRSIQDATTLEVFCRFLDTVMDSYGNMESILEGLFMLEAASATLSQAKGCDATDVSDVCLASSSRLIRVFLDIWNPLDRSWESQVWSDSFLPFLRSARGSNGFLVRSRDYVDELCKALYIEGKSVLAYQLLHTIISEAMIPCQKCRTTSSQMEEFLLSMTRSLSEEEKDEFEEDFRLARECLPPTLMAELTKWSTVTCEGNEGVLSNSRLLGNLFSWLILLEYLDGASVSHPRHRGAMVAFVQQTEAGRAILDIALSGMLPADSGTTEFRFSLDISSEPSTVSFPTVSALVLFRTAQTMPTLMKTWWNELPRKESSRVQRFVESKVSQKMLSAELSKIKKSSVLEDMDVTGSLVSREVVATYMQDECKLSVLIRVPVAFPLRNVEVDCHRTLGVPEKRWRRWALQIMMMLNTTDGSIQDALVLWKENVDKEFEGVEPCPVCYSVICVKTHTLPNLQCKTCSNRFHSSCLYKWFNSSGKSQCVLCQQPWSGTRV